MTKDLTISEKRDALWELLADKEPKVGDTISYKTKIKGKLPQATIVNQDKQLKTVSFVPLCTRTVLTRPLCDIILGSEPTLNDVLLGLGETTGDSPCNFYSICNKGEVTQHREDGDDIVIYYDLTKSFLQQSDETIKKLYQLLKPKAEDSATK